MLGKEAAFAEKYGREVFTFSFYYKYSFTYSNDTAMVVVGGSSDDIYRADMTPEMTLIRLLDECGAWYAKGMDLTTKEWFDLDRDDVWDVLDRMKAEDREESSM